ncbi:hypothetical protein YC2023_050258 [Brassica napus]
MKRLGGAAQFLSKGDFEGDKTKTLPWSCSAVIFAGNLSDYDESRFSFMRLDSSFPFDLQIYNGLGPHLLRPYLLRQYLLQLLLLKDYLDDFQEFFYDVLLPGLSPGNKTS